MTHLEALIAHLPEDERAKYLAAVQDHAASQASARTPKAMTPAEVHTYRKMKAKLRRAVQHGSTSRSL